MNALRPTANFSKVMIMTSLSTQTRTIKGALLACTVGVSLVATPAFAQQVDPNRLLEIMVQKGLVTRAEADAMRAEAAAKAPPAPQAQAPIQGGVAADGTQTVPYVPQVVRDQIAEQVRAELGSQAQAEGWSKPGETPEWTRRIQLYGDVRVRGEGRFYEDPVYNGPLWVGGNYPDFLDWGAINRGDGYDVSESNPINPPYLNTAENRRRMQVRARLGIRAQINDWVSANLRLATGGDKSPVSTNQTLGADGSSNYEFWVDRASIRLAPTSDVAIDFGRFGNPFWTSDLVYDNDMNFDGIAFSGSRALTKQLRLFGAAGAFPVFNTSFNFGSRNAPTVDGGGGGAFASKDKYLFAVQTGLEFQLAENQRARIAGGYLRYDGVQGEFSSPCRWDQDVCDTDATRPAFQQFGNTMMALRQISPDPSVPPGASPEVQYFGLASKFELLNLRGQFEYSLSDRIGVRVDGDFVKNLGFDRSAIAALAQNNQAPEVLMPNPDQDPADPNDNFIRQQGAYDGGDTGWQARLTVGRLDLGFAEGAWVAERGDWAAHIGYRHIESDAVIDGFADSDFGLGGTNAKGWIAGANYGIARNTLIGLRWMSTDEVAGPPLSVDRLFIDLQTRF